jgi:protein arginine N-methyltransferase 1
VEHLTLPANVDVIVSEWMGHCLLYESMLDSVLFARDAFLAEGGFLFPNRAKMEICAFAMNQKLSERFQFWDRIEDFALGYLNEVTRAQPAIEGLSVDDLVSSACTFVQLDLMTITGEDLSFDREFTITFERDCEISGFAVWFDIQFDGPDASSVLSTSPRAPLTHWQQTLFFLEQTAKVTGGEVINGRFQMRPNAKMHRNQDIVITYVLHGESYCRQYLMK